MSPRASVAPCAPASAALGPAPREAPPLPHAPSPQPPSSPLASACRSLDLRFWLGTLDLAPACLFRIAFGFAVLGSVLDLEPVLFSAFSDEGFAPRSVLFGGDFPRPGHLALMDISGPPWVAYAYWAATVAACLCFIVGFRTRLATAASFVLVSGLIERNYMIFDSSDDVSRILLFWSLFIPLGRRYSVDAALARARGRPLAAHGSALPVRIAQAQLAWIYLCTFLRKLPGKTWHDGTAVHIALGLDHYYTRPLGHLLYHLPWTTTCATYFTLALEASFLPLVFLPVFQPRAKAFALACGFLFHAGILATMCIGGFSWIMVGAYPLLFEPAWAEWIAVRAGRLVGCGTARIVIDSSCGACLERVSFFRAFDPAGRIDTTVRNAELDSMHRLRVIDGRGVVREGWEAALCLCRKAPALWLFGIAGAVPGLRQGGERLAAWITTLRAELHHRPPAPAIASIDWSRQAGATAIARAGKVVVAALMVALFAACVVSSSPTRLATHVPSWLTYVLQTLEIEQRWAMFAPDPPHTDVWLKGIGRLEDGTEVDVLRGDERHGPLPPPVHGLFASRWTAISDAMAWGGSTTLLQFGRFLCRHWNDPARPRGRALLATFQISRMQRDVPPVGRDPGAWQEVPVWNHVCLARKR